MLNGIGISIDIHPRDGNVTLSLAKYSQADEFMLRLNVSGEIIAVHSLSLKEVEAMAKSLSDYCQDIRVGHAIA